MKKVLILEDNPITVVYLKQIIDEMDIKIDIYSFDTVQDAYQCALEHHIDLFLVDVILDTKVPGDTSGLKFIENIRKVQSYVLAPVIVLTALEDSKMYTYEKLHCYSFVEKPFEPQQIKRLIGQCLSYYEKEMEEEKTLFFRKDGILFAVDAGEIVHVNIQKQTMHIHTNKDDTLSVPYMSLKKFLADASCDYFVQCSKSCAVNKRYIENIDYTNRYIGLKDNLGKVEIGMRYRSQLKDELRCW